MLLCINHVFYVLINFSISATNTTISLLLLRLATVLSNFRGTEIFLYTIFCIFFYFSLKKWYRAPLGTVDDMI